MKTVILFFGLFSVSLSHAQKLNLQLKLKAGETYAQVQTSQLAIHQDINGKSQDIETTIEGKMTYHVKEIRDSVFLMDVSFERLSIEMKLPQASMQFSSDDTDTANMMAQILKTLTHQPIFARMTNRGRFLEVRSDSLIERVVNHFPEIPLEQKQQIKQQLRQTWGEDAFKSSFEMLSAVYPDRNVKVGDRWPIKSQLKTTMLLNLDAVYTFTSISAEGYAIHGDVKITPAANNEPTIVNGMPILYEMQGTTVSDIVLNKETSWIAKASIKQNLGGKASIKDSEQVPGGMVIPMTITSITTLSEK